MCFNPEQKQQIDAGNIVVMFVYDTGVPDAYNIAGGFLTAAGLNDPSVVFDMLGSLVGEVKMQLMAADTSPVVEVPKEDITFIDRPASPQEEQTITAEDVGKVEDIL